MDVVIGKQNDVEIASQGAVLKTIVEQVELRAKFLFCREAGGITALADKYRNLQAASQQQRFIAELSGGSGRVD